ncbi:MAG: aminotransferase class V-fold PLP-dependent enzyme [Pseudomonadota bacterium]
MSLNIAEVRQHTPACSELMHFNNAGASLSPLPVHERLLQHLTLEQRIGGYEAAQQEAAAVENFYNAFARLLHCESDEIAYSESATHAWNAAFHAIPLRAGQRILTGQSEYSSNYMAFLQLAREKGLHIDVIPNDEQGCICLDRLADAISDDVGLIALTHVPSQSGVIHPAAEVGQLAKAHDILYLLDACQSAGQIDLDVATLGCDMLTGTGRKYLRGPRGTGFLYVRHTALERLQPDRIDFHSARWTAENQYEFRADARRFESWECSVAGKIALGAAADYATALGMHNIEHRVRELAAAFRDQLRKLPGIRVHESGSSLSGIVTFSKDGEPAESLQRRLHHSGINTSVTRLSGNLLDLPRRGLGDINRASVHYFNTEEEIERFCQVLGGP